MIPSFDDYVSQAAAFDLPEQKVFELTLNLILEGISSSAGPNLAKGLLVQPIPAWSFRCS
jgi:hypothetical protein